MATFGNRVRATVVLGTAILLGLHGGAGAVEFDGGTGEPGDPYRVATAAQLVSVGSVPALLGRHFALVADIDLDPNLSGGRVFSGAVIAPWDSSQSLPSSVPFTGSLDGRGHTIKNLTIVSSRPCVGLFGRIEWPGRVQNLGIVDAQIKNTAVASMSETAEVRWGAGILAGESWGVIKNCFAAGSVSGTYDVGGLVGDNRGTVFACYSVATVRGIRNVAGLVGYNGGGVVAQCYAGGGVWQEAAETLGGLVGFSTGAVVDSFFLDPNDGGGPANGLGTPLTDAAMRRQASFAGWDFSGTDADGAMDSWFASPGSYPHLAWQKDRTGLVWVPEVQACSLEIARTKIGEAGLVVGRTSYESADDIEAGRVIRLQPGHPVAPGTSVDIVVSSGPYDWSANPGDGSDAKPYQIGNVDQFGALSRQPQLWDKHFILTADIDLTGRVYSGAPISPQTNQAENEYGDKEFVGTPFEGRFDGRGRTIKGLTIISASEYAGLLGMVGWRGRVQDLGVTGACVIGRIRAEEDEPSRDTGLRPTRCGAGLLAGENGGTIGGCMSDGLVIGTADVGGLVGHNLDTVIACYSMASVAGGHAPGGLVGTNYGRLVCCYSSGPVSGKDAAGLVGSRGGWARHCFWDVQTSGCRIGCVGQGLVTADMMDADLYSLRGWGGDPNWVISDGNDYPRLAWEGTAGRKIPEPVIDWLEGSGTVDDPYRIVAAEQISLLCVAGVLWDKHFVLCADLDLTGVVCEPIGVCAGTGFTGCFDGGGHVLSHLTIDGGLMPDNRGLFGYVDSQGQILHLGLRQAVVAGRDYTGSLAGYNAGTIDSCFADAAVTGNDWVGGLIGENVGRVLRCYSLGSVVGRNESGGLVGVHGDGLVAYCYAAAIVTTTQTWGDAEGLIGESIYPAVSSYYLQPADEDPWGIHAGTSLVDSEMRKRSSFAEWDFYGTDADGAGDHWFMPAGRYPVLSWQTDVTALRVIPKVRNTTLAKARQLLAEAGFALGSVSEDYDLSVWSGRALQTRPLYYAPAGQAVVVVQSLGVHDWNKNPGRGTQAAPYQIQTAGQLECAANQSSGRHFALVNDIDLSGRVYSDSVLPGFSGFFDGNGHRITCLEGFDTALFDCIWGGAAVRNLTLDRVAILGSRGGGLAFYSHGDITNCHIIGQVAGEGRGFGGLTGYNTGTIRECSMRGVVMGTGPVWGLGGLVGDNKGIVEECRVDLCEVVEAGAAWGLGGVVGENNGTVRNCYSEVRLSSLRAAWDIGGLVGENNATVMDCWAFSEIFYASPAWRLGGLIGSNTGAVTNCYLHGNSSYYGLGTVLSTTKMCRRASFEGWDFAGDTADGTKGIWTIREGLDYPRLWWE